MASTGAGFAEALALGVAPFPIGDALKSILAALLPGTWGSCSASSLDKDRLWRPDGSLAAGPCLDLLFAVPLQDHWLQRWDLNPRPPGYEITGAGVGFEPTTSGL